MTKSLKMILILLLCVLLFVFSAGCTSLPEDNKTSGTNNESVPVAPPTNNTSGSQNQNFNLAAAMVNTDKMMMSKFIDYTPYWGRYQIQDDGETYGIGYVFESKISPTSDVIKHAGIIFYDADGNVLSATVDGQVLYKDGKDYKYNWYLRFPRPPSVDDV